MHTGYALEPVPLTWAPFLRRLSIGFVPTCGETCFSSAFRPPPPPLPGSSQEAVDRVRAVLKQSLSGPPQQEALFVVQT